MKILQLITIFLVTMCSLSTFAGNIASPVGLWKTYNEDGNPEGYVRISETNGIFSGVIEKSLSSDKDDEYCTLCRDERKDQKLVGMTIIKNVKAKGDVFSGGEILDPFSGNTYKVKLKLKDAGQKLEVRGFLGISLFGRTQVWQRTEGGD